MSITRSALFASLLATAAFGCRNANRERDIEIDRTDRTGTMGTDTTTGTTGERGMDTTRGTDTTGGIGTTPPAPDTTGTMRGDEQFDQNRMARPGTGATRGTGTGVTGTNPYDQPGAGTTGTGTTGTTAPTEPGTTGTGTTGTGAGTTMRYDGGVSGDAMGAGAGTGTPRAGTGTPGAGTGTTGTPGAGTGTTGTGTTQGTGSGTSGTGTGGTAYPPPGGGR